MRSRTSKRRCRSSSSGWPSSTARWRTRARVCSRSSPKLQKARARVGEAGAQDHGRSGLVRWANGQVYRNARQARRTRFRRQELRYRAGQGRRQIQLQGPVHVRGAHPSGIGERRDPLARRRLLRGPGARALSDRRQNPAARDLSLDRSRHAGRDRESGEAERVAARAGDL